MLQSTYLLIKMTWNLQYNQYKKLKKLKSFLISEKPDYNNILAAERSTFLAQNKQLYG